MNELQERCHENAPVVPLFPGPRVGRVQHDPFHRVCPTEDNPYATLSARSAHDSPGADHDSSRSQ